VNGNGNNDDRPEEEVSEAVSATTGETQSDLVEAEERDLHELRQRIGETSTSSQESD
jgi:hypothetical protein